MNVKQLIVRLLEYENDAEVCVQLGCFQLGNGEDQEPVREINVDNSGRVLLECDYTLGRNIFP